ncbi:hypothetical protein, partial [Alistipes finegoldii]|uniref:hypothetical protein n=1 Tax=Alistipes finegoldii TaxID=214856 RepID=UPI00321AFF96
GNPPQAAGNREIPCCFVIYCARFRSDPFILPFYPALRRLKRKNIWIYLQETLLLARHLPQNGSSRRSRLHPNKNCY